MRNFLRTVVLTCLMLTVSTTAWARCEDHVPQLKPQNASRDIVGHDMDTIIDRGYMDFALYDDFAPWSFSEAGKVQGIDADLARLIAEEFGVKARLKLVAAGENLDADLRNWVWKGPIVGGSVANVMMHVPYDSEFACRIEQVVFGGTFHVEQMGIAYRKSDYPDDKPVPAYFRYDSVAVENDSIADFYLSGLAGGQLLGNIQRYVSTGQAMEMLAQGKVMAAMGSLSQLEYGLTDDLAVHTPPLPGFAVGKWTVGVATHFAYRPLGYAVDDAIYAALQDGRLEKIFEKYGVTLTPPELR